MLDRIPSCNKHTYVFLTRERSMRDASKADAITMVSGSIRITQLQRGRGL